MPDIAIDPTAKVGSVDTGPLSLSSGLAQHDHAGSPVLRVKRKRNADPIDAFIVATEDAERREKRARTGPPSGADVARVFQRIDTVESGAFDDGVRLRATIERLRDIRSTKQSPKMKPAALQLSQERREDQIAAQNADSKAARYKVVKMRRQFTDEDVDFKLLDVEEQSSTPLARNLVKSRHDEDDVMSSLMPMVQEYLKLQEGDDYVYDLYYAHASPVSPSIHARVAELSFDQDPDIFLHDNGNSSDSDAHSNIGDDHDSNAEDYYANEYPNASDLDDSWGEESDDDGEYDPYD
ncbi:hypothetical protein DFJ77DRAFT_511592 [Powellomyces hirtus]|nr:hypothetical protein DFJ77DRAFT_511592 [Powellomyces hirtus]